MGEPGTTSLTGSGDPANVKANNFGILRLIFAACVIVSHSPELIDGNRSREIFTRLFGTVSLGGVSVDGFFIISGYLITRSCAQRHSTFEFLLRRIARIVPGYLVSFLICVVCVAPLAGAPQSSFWPREVARLVTEAFRLLPPTVSGVFAGLPYPALNGSMWTIAYEMRCYIVALLLGLVGLYGRQSRFVFLALTAALLVITAVGLFDESQISIAGVIGSPSYNIRLIAIFASGASFYLFKDYVEYRWTMAAAAAAALLLLIRFPALTEPAVAIFGGYLVFWVAFGLRSLALSRFANRTDVSYGLYLYAFPLQNLLVYYLHLTDPWILTFMTLPLACFAGYLSWMGVEQPILRLSSRWIAARRRGRQTDTVGFLRSEQGLSG